MTNVEKLRGQWEKYVQEAGVAAVGILPMKQILEQGFVPKDGVDISTIICGGSLILGIAVLYLTVAGMYDYSKSKNPVKPRTLRDYPPTDSILPEVAPTSRAELNNHIQAQKTELDELAVRLGMTGDPKQREIIVAQMQICRGSIKSLKNSVRHKPTTF